MEIEALRRELNRVQQENPDLVEEVTQSKTGWVMK